VPELQGDVLQDRGGGVMLTGIAIGVAATLAVLVVVSIFVKRHQDAQAPPFDMEKYANEQRWQMSFLIMYNDKQAEMLARIAVALESIATDSRERMKWGA
jgi:formate dehydrogenase maturation protein FdhE